MTRATSCCASSAAAADGRRPGVERRWCCSRLAPTLHLDEHGYVLTGRDLPPTGWPLAREPYPFETSRPGVFAAGDVRHGSVKRVAGAAGEGSVAVGSVHACLAEPTAVPQRPKAHSAARATLT